MIKKSIPFLIIFLVSCSGKKSEQVSFDYFEVTQKNLTQTIETSGSVEIENEVQIQAPLGGRIDKLFIEEGQHVIKGQKVGIMSSNERIKMLEMAAHKGSSEVKYWEKQLLPTSVFAPVDGVVIDIRHREGDIAKTYIAKISQGMIVRANIDEVDIRKITTGQKVFITFDVVSEEVFEGTLAKISQVSENISSVNVYPVEISLPESKKLEAVKPKIGMSVTLNFPVHEVKDAICINAKAVNHQSNVDTKVTLKSGEKRKVTLGHVYDSDVHIISGLAKGDEVRVPKFQKKKSKAKKSPFGFLGS